ncbi:unnamed protein product [Leptosia nina]|uniref:Peptidase S1 domain-containing protein n=1 Tax=Leptosia nina TaxID=320188 RepID=A0AAV1JR47_9NEOP
MDVLNWCFFLFIQISMTHTLNDAGDSIKEKEWRSQISNHQAWKKLDKFECGFNAADRIIGGMNATLGQFPWIVRIGYKCTLKLVVIKYSLVVGEEELDWMCGGALVTDRHVITAAHCLQTDGETFEVAAIRIGEYNTETDPDCQMDVCAPPYQDRKVRIKRIHPSFNKPPFHNDIAVILLDSPVQLHDYVSPICLPRNEQLSDLKIGELMTVAGWGKINMTTEELAKILQFVSVPIVKPETCGAFGKGFKLSRSEICAGAQLNKDACGGDSGGPLMKVFDTIDGPKNYLMGVVSFGPTICGIRKPGVYASVPQFMKWILDNIKRLY